MLHDQKGDARLRLIIGCAVVTLVFITGGLMWQNYQPAKKSTKAAANTTSPKLLAIQPLKMPAGWSVSTGDNLHVLLSNQTTKCFTEVSFTSDRTESNSPDIDQSQQTIDSIESKGYGVIDLTSKKLTVVTADGNQQIDARSMKVSGFDNNTFQEYASFVTGDGKYLGKIQLSCPNETDILSAENALLAITMNI